MLSSGWKKASGLEARVAQYLTTGSSIITFFVPLPASTPHCTQNILITVAFPPKSSGNAKDEAEAADAGFEHTEEEEGRGGRRRRSALTPTPGPPLIGGSPCTGAKVDLVLSFNQLDQRHHRSCDPNHHSQPPGSGSLSPTRPSQGAPALTSCRRRRGCLTVSDYLSVDLFHKK